MAQLDFNAHEVEPQSFEPLPAGKYNVVIVASDTKTAKSGSGEYLQLTMQVIDGEHKGRQIWSRLNLVNSSQQAVQIARSQLSAICRAVGVMTPKDSTELHDLPLVITVRCKKRADNGEITNEIGAYMPRASHVAVPVEPPTEAPWERRK